MKKFWLFLLLPTLMLAGCDINFGGGGDEDGDGDGGYGDEIMYTIAILDAEHGRAEAKGWGGERGDELVVVTQMYEGGGIFLVPLAEEGYKIDYWQLLEGGDVQIHDGQFEFPEISAYFTMPASNVVVAPVFREKRLFDIAFKQFDENMTELTGEDEMRGTVEMRVNGQIVTQVREDDVVTMTAIPKEGYEFLEWGTIGDIWYDGTNDPTSPTITFTMTEYTTDVWLSFGVEDDGFDVLSAIEDPVFKTYCRMEYDTDGDGRLSRPEAHQARGNLILTGLNITSLAGIEYLTELVGVYCNDNRLTELDVSKLTKLNTLHCYNNELTELNLSENRELQNLDCHNNQLTMLITANQPKLINLSCYDNEIPYLDLVYNTALLSLYCNNNRLTELNTTKNTTLRILVCSFNEIETLSLSNWQLTDLICNDNKLQQVNVSGSMLLSVLMCGNNPGRDGVFAVWTGRDNFLPPMGFTTGDWYYDSQRVEIEYQPSSAK